MTFSVLTNPSAASAVLNLNKTLTALNTTQERINTGLKVGKARDDASTFAIATGMRSDIAGFKSVRENLSLGKSTLGVASAAGEQIAEQLKEIKAKVVQASNNSQGRDLIQNSIDNAMEQIKSITTAATFNGVNLINGEETNRGNSFTVVSSLDRDSVGELTLGTVDVAYEDLSIDEQGRGLGDIKDLNVTEGKSTESRISRDDPVSLAIDLTDVDGSASAPGDQFTLEFLDAEGAEQSVTFTITSVDADAAADNFLISTGGATGDASTDGSLRQSLTNLLQDGGALAGLGFEVVDGTAASVVLQRDEATGSGELVGFSVDTDNNAVFTDPTDTTVTEAAPGVAQVSLEFNATTRQGETNATQLEAGDEIEITLNNGTNDRTFKLRVGEKGDSSFANGAAITGTSSTYFLSYDSAVTNTSTGDAITTDQLAQTVATLMTDAATTLENDIEAFIGADTIGMAPTTTDGLAVQASGNKVILTDKAQAATGPGASIVSFNMDGSPGGSLDFEYMLQQVDAAENHLKQVVGRIGAAEQRIETQSVFIDSLTKALNDGVGTLVDADMSEEAARLQALQVQQQLGLQALSIANSQPQSILSLFGG
jgi:flagellin